MIYGYIRVSTDKQTVENQRYEINQFCERSEMVVGKWIEETISGSKNLEERKLGKLLKKMKKGDVLICSELSRLGRNLLMIMSILNECMNRDIQVWTIVPPKNRTVSLIGKNLLNLQYVTEKKIQFTV